MSVAVSMVLVLLSDMDGQAQHARGTRCHCWLGSPGREATSHAHDGDDVPVVQGGCCRDKRRVSAIVYLPAFCGQGATGLGALAAGSCCSCRWVNLRSVSLLGPYQ